MMFEQCKVVIFNNTIFMKKQKISGQIFLLTSLNAVVQDSKNEVLIIFIDRNVVIHVEVVADLNRIMHTFGRKRNQAETQVSVTLLNARGKRGSWMPSKIFSIHLGKFLTTFF